MTTPSLLADLDRALAYAGGTHTLGDVLRQILAGTAQLWEAEDAVIVTEVHDYPRMRVVHFWLAAGRLDAVVDLSHRVLNWAKGAGCARATLAGRKGWERVLAADGWEPMLIVMGRDV